MPKIARARSDALDSVEDCCMVTMTTSVGDTATEPVAVPVVAPDASVTVSDVGEPFRYTV